MTHIAQHINAPRGEDARAAKLTDDDIRIIRQLIADRDALRAEASKLRNKDIAKKFDVHPRTIDKISTRRTWGHVK